MSVLVAFVAAVLAGCGAWLLLQRRLSRIIIGVGLLGHAANLLLLVSGSRRGGEPLIGLGDPDEFTDPLPQALALTAIVITFGITTFLLAVGFRAWQVTRDDEVEDDIEDRYFERMDRDLADEMVAERAQAAEEGRTWDDTPDDAPSRDAPTGIDTAGIGPPADHRDQSAGDEGRT
ncbi:MAG: NADH-quinone oxidoreductase subunit K [Ilumatobacteraceae bacterium]